ncbi:hypothetical protein [Caviibacterium pharyngocola]|uniref:DUF155 domain-containing protein n=1 Tax=Caviibacterium pharyngocola TaxID=28159 RepID=A0A2M8RTM5_9PAST|nr:hypothetical protein [Caviibacterium pharyngocola]PJG82229.1 hypothetical protein CVP04_10225 [Caviibacterium pharyngocola]
MKNIYFGKIYALDEILSLKEKICLCEQQIKFLNPILQKTTAVEEDFANLTLKVTFFHGSRFVRTLCFSSYRAAQLFSSKPEQQQALSEIFGKTDSLGNIVLTAGAEGLSEALIRNASWFIRSSDTLEQGDFMILPNEWRAIDGRGMALFERFGKIDHAYRQVFLIMLALAYYDALHQISEELAAMLVEPINVEELDKLYTEAAVFNARYYFDNPVEFSRYALFQAWQDVREAYHLREKNAEVTSQLAQVHQILSYTQQKKEQTANEERNLKLAVFGITLSILGIVEVIDIVSNWLS